MAALALIVISAAGCATSERPIPRRSIDVVGVERGRSIAELRCAICHAVGPTGDSPRLTAPPFRTLHMSYDRVAFAKRLGEIAGDGSHTMPGYDLSRDDFDDLVTYLSSRR